MIECVKKKLFMKTHHDWVQLKAMNMNNDRRPAHKQLILQKLLVALGEMGASIPLVAHMFGRVLRARHAVVRQCCRMQSHSHALLLLLCFVAVKRWPHKVMPIYLENNSEQIVWKMFLCTFFYAYY